MMIPSEPFLPADFSDGQEKLLRAVWAERYPHLWNTKKNRPSSAAFKDKNGLSVDRGGRRPDAEAVNYAKEHLQGFITAATVDMCREIKASPKYLPSRSNPYHSEIHGSDCQVPLSPEQARFFAQHVVIIYGPEEWPVSIQY